MNAFLGNYLIGLREGLEATLVVSILIAFLVKSDRRDKLIPVWVGVTVAVAISVGFGAVLFYVSDVLSFEQREIFEAVTSIIAVCFVTWMIFWMRRFARRLAGELRSRLEQAMTLGTVAVVTMAFFAVVREGLETVTLFFAAAQGASTTTGPLLGISAGLVTAVAIGWLLYLSAVRINLTKFFTWTGLLLILVAAGILKYGIHDFQEAGILPGINTIAFDISSWYDPTAWYAALLGGMFNVTAAPTVLETVAWVAYAVPALVAFLVPARPSAPAPSPQEAQPAPSAEPAEPAEPSAPIRTA